MMIQKMSWAQKHGKRYFYPGYCAPGYPAFEYKLTLAPQATYYFKLTSHRWNRWSPTLTLPIKVIQEKLGEMSDILSQHNIAHSVLAYTYYDTNTAAHLRRFNLLDQPMIIALHSTQTHQFPIIYYDFIQGCFQLRKAQKFFTLNPEQPIPPYIFCEAILKAHIVFFIDPDPLRMISFIQENIVFKKDHFRYKTKGFIDKGE